MTDGLRIEQLRGGPDGTARVKQLGVDHVLARESDGSMTVYDREDFTMLYPAVVERSSLERIEARRAMNQKESR